MGERHVQPPTQDLQPETGMPHLRRQSRDDRDTTVDARPFNVQRLPPPQTLN